MSPRSQQSERIIPLSPKPEENVVAADEALTQAQADAARLREELVRMKERSDDQARRLIAAELAQRAAEEEISRVREEAEARRRVDLGAVEKRVAEEVLRAQANEVAKRRKAEQEVARLRADLLAAEQATQSHRRKSEDALQKLLEQERSLRVEAHAEVEKYKAAAKEAWQSAEEEVERLAAEAEKARAELREEQVRRKRLEQELLKLRKQLEVGSEEPPSDAAELRTMAQQTAQQELSSMRERGKPPVEQAREVDSSKVSLDDIRRLQAVYRSYVNPATAAEPAPAAATARATTDIPLFDASTLSTPAAPEDNASKKDQTVAKPLEGKGLGARFAAVEMSSKRDEFIPGRISLDIDDPSLNNSLADAQDEFEDDFVVFYPTDEDIIASTQTKRSSPPKEAVASEAFFNEINTALAAKPARDEITPGARVAAYERLDSAVSSSATGSRRRLWVTVMMGLVVAGGVAAFYLSQQSAPSPSQSAAAMPSKVAPAPVQSTSATKPAQPVNNRKAPTSGSIKREK